MVSVKPTRPPPSRPGWAAAAASAAAAGGGGGGGGTSNGGYGGYAAPAAATGAGGYGGYSAPAATPAAATSGGYSDGYGQGATNGGAAAGAMPSMPAMAAPPLPPKPKPSEPQAKVLYDYDPAGQEGMVAVSAGQASFVRGVAYFGLRWWWWLLLSWFLNRWRSSFCSGVLLCVEVSFPARVPLARGLMTLGLFFSPPQAQRSIHASLCRVVHDAYMMHAVCTNNVVPKRRVRVKGRAPAATSDFVVGLCRDTRIPCSCISCCKALFSSL